MPTHPTAPATPATTTAAAPPPEAPPTDALQRARWSLVTMFGVFGLVQTSWMGRLPSVRVSLGISAADLGTMLVVGAVGSLVGVTLVGAMIARLGSRVTLGIGMVGAMAGFLLLGLATVIGSPALFAAGLLLNGVVVASTNVPVNLEAARVEKILGTSILPHVHAAFSVGALLGSGVAATTSMLHIHVAWHIIGVAALVTVARAFLIGPGTRLADGPRPRSAAATTGPGSPPRGVRLSGGTLRAWTEPRTLLIGLVILAASMSEGAAANWLNLGVVDGFATSEAIGAAAYGTFVVSMLVVRLAGPVLIGRFGRVAVLRASGASALAGLLAFGLAPGLALAWAGIVLWGVGAALAWPVGTSAAADDPSRAAARVAVVNSFASVASLSIPPVLGLLADAWGVRHALLVISVTMVVSLAVAGQVRPEKPSTSDGGEPGTDDGPGAAAATARSAGVARQEAGQGLDDADVAVEPRDLKEVVGV